MSVWIPSSWPPFHPSHSETCGSTSKTQSQHLRAASENCGSIITRGSQGRLYLSVYLNFCNNLRQMRNVSVFSWVKLLYQPPPNGFPGKVVGRHFAFAICVATFVDAVPSPRSQKSNANCICRSRRTNFTFPKFHLQTFWHRLQIECLIATKWHSRWQQHMHWAVEAFGPLYWPALHSAFPSLVVKNCWLFKCGRAVSVASTICCSGLCLCLKYCLLFKAY